PMPGTILDIKVSVGQAVKKGDVLCVLEAMKMENDIPAPADGTVAAIKVSKGASVQAGEALVSLS
ncbi:MAG: biotin/lipoyl-binding protein, partial [Ruminococcaceae bacterium]|nr:biotin/lipoyl-binding protein [Oscillospiraceae bacterium]